MQIGKFQALRLECEDWWSLVDVEMFSSYQPRSGTQLLKEINYSNGMAMVNISRTAAGYVLQEQAVPIEETYTGSHTQTLDVFLSESDGYYSDPFIVVKEMKNSTLQLCEMMKTSDNARFGHTEHNGRVLRRHLQTSVKVAKALNAFSTNKRSE